MIKCVIMFLFLFPKNQKGTKKMQCLMTYKWVKLLRSHLPGGKGLMGYWAKLASHAAFRKGQALYCGHYNRVAPGMWSGGMVGFKRILGLGSRQSVIDVMNQLMATLTGLRIMRSFTLRRRFTQSRTSGPIIRCSWMRFIHRPPFGLNRFLRIRN